LQVRRQKLIINDDSELLLTFSWGNFTHGVSGHLFECIDYYLILKDNFKVKILIPEKIENLGLLIRDKYDLKMPEYNDLMRNIILGDSPTLVKTNNIFFVDGSYKNFSKSNILSKNIITFMCGDFTLLDHDRDNLFVLLDYRVYPKVPKNGTNYIKKILFDKYNTRFFKEGDKTLIYATENCRETDITLDNQLKLTKKDLPYLGLFNTIDSYYYTPVPRKFDCSSRLIPECKFYNKKVIFDQKVKEYFFEDTGLFFRYLDTKTNFESLFLKPDDKIIEILKNIIGG
jgi:hypothetical protein